MATTPPSNGAPGARSRARSSRSSSAKAGPTVAAESRTIPGGVSVAQTAAKLTINRQFLPDRGHILVPAHLVVFFETHLDRGGVHGRIARVNGGKSRGHADIRNDHAQFVGGHYLPDLLFDSGDVPVRHFNSHSG